MFVGRKRKKSRNFDKIKTMLTVKHYANVIYSISNIQRCGQLKNLRRKDRKESQPEYFSKLDLLCKEKGNS